MCTYCDKRMLKTQLKKHMGFCTNYLLRRYIDDANAERRDMKETIKQYTDELVEQRRLLVNQGKEIKELRSQVANLKDENSELHRGIGEMSTQAIATHILSNLLKQMGIEYDSSRSQTPTFGKDDYTDASNEKNDIPIQMDACRANDTGSSFSDRFDNNVLRNTVDYKTSPFLEVNSATGKSFVRCFA